MEIIPSINSLNYSLVIYRNYKICTWTDGYLFAAFDDEGNTLEPDQCQRLFTLPAKALNTEFSFSDAEKSKCAEIYHTHQLGIIEENRKRNHNFFDEEVDKLENGVRMYATALSLK